VVDVVVEPHLVGAATPISVASFRMNRTSPFCTHHFGSNSVPTSHRRQPFLYFIYLVSFSLVQSLRPVASSSRFVLAAVLAITPFPDSSR
jgi:hypothetical protein